MVVRIIFFLNSKNLICRGTAISKCFRESLGVRDNESWLKFMTTELIYWVWSWAVMQCAWLLTPSIPVLNSILVSELTSMITNDQKIYSVFNPTMLYNVYLIITKTRLFKYTLYTENFTSKNWKFPDKKTSDIFLISAQNIDCGYTLELPRRGGYNE